MVEDVEIEDATIILILLLVVLYCKRKVIYLFFEMSSILFPYNTGSYGTLRTNEVKVGRGLLLSLHNTSRTDRARTQQQSCQSRNDATPKSEVVIHHTLIVVRACRLRFLSARENALSTQSYYRTVLATR